MFGFTNLSSLLHCYHQRKIRLLKLDLNSHLRISRPPPYPLSYRVNGDWWRVLSNLTGRNIFATTQRLSWRTRSVSILFQNYPQRCENLICLHSYTATTNEKPRFATSNPARANEFFVRGSSARARMKTN